MPNRLGHTNVNLQHLEVESLQQVRQMKPLPWMLLARTHKNRHNIGHKNRHTLCHLLQTHPTEGGHPLNLCHIDHYHGLNSCSSQHRCQTGAQQRNSADRKLRTRLRRPM